MPYSINIFSKAKILNKTFTDFWRGLKKYMYNDRKNVATGPNHLLKQRVYFVFLKRRCPLLFSYAFLGGNEQQDV